jgi:hypothetical protein
MFLNYSIRKLQPGLHAIADQFGVIIEFVKQIHRPNHATKIHIATDYILYNYLALICSSSCLSHTRFQILESVRMVRVKPPFAVVIPCLPIFDRVIDIFRHESVAPALEIQNMPAGEVPFDFIFPPVLQNLHIEFRAEGGFTPAQLSQAVASWLIIAKELRKVGLIINMAF